MKKNVNYVANEKFAKIVAAAGLQGRTQAAFTRVDGPNGRRVYIANTKQVGRIDASGWEPQVDGVIAMSKEEAKSLRLGAVRGQVDFSKTEAEILQAFEDLLLDMIDAPKAAAKLETEEVSEDQAEA